MSRIYDMGRILKQQYENGYQKGIENGVKIMMQRMLLAVQNGTPINIEGRAYFIHDDMDNLHRIFAELEGGE